MISLWPFKREPKIEKRASASGFTAEVISMREAYISGRRGLAELTATAQACCSLWEHGLSMSDVAGTELLRRSTLAMIGRSLALRGEALFLIRDDRLVPCSDWDLRTRDGRPIAYRLSISEAGGGTTMTALAAEVLHVRIGADVVTPWLGQAPLKRASLTASMLHAVEQSLAETFEAAPIGSAVLPFPESPETDRETLGRSFVGKHGRVLLRESVAVTSAGGPMPRDDWQPSSLSPDLSKSMTAETLDAARHAICAAFGVLPSLFAIDATGPQTREAQRHLCQWTLEPIAELVAEEASEKLGTEIKLDTTRPLQAFDTSGRARALATIIESMARAKEAGLAPGDFAGALKLVDWSE